MCVDYNQRNNEINHCLSELDNTITNQINENHWNCILRKERNNQDNRFLNLKKHLVSLVSNKNGQVKKLIK